MAKARAVRIPLNCDGLLQTKCAFYLSESFHSCVQSASSIIFYLLKLHFHVHLGRFSLNLLTSPKHFTENSVATMLYSVVWDYIVVGGGLAGNVVSNRLLALDNAVEILVIEAGPKVDNRTDILYANSTNTIEGDFGWNYYSLPQASLDGRQIQSAAGKALGGGSVINTCM